MARPGLLDRMGAGVRVRRLAHRTPFTAPVSSTAPSRPLGVKLELTHRCNLRCGFCYTDSPRHTLAGTPDLADDEWRRIADEALALGVVEAVVTGGEPLLRRGLALDLVERFDAAGAGVSLNTNGWFVDDHTADRLSRLAGLTAYVSVDGATPAAHDGARGVPGSWLRAVGAVHRLLERGVRVHVLHVVTPDNHTETVDFLEAMWDLGVPWVRLVAVLQIGAAGRSSRWKVKTRPLHAVAEEFRGRHGAAMTVGVSVPSAAIASMSDGAPESILVRPDGTARIDALIPFAFGSVAREGLATCWGRIVAGWSDPRIRRWAGGIRDEELHRADLVSYRDADAPLGAAQENGGAPGGDPPVLPRHATAQPADLPAARRHVRDLALSRRYRLGPVRWGGEGDGSRIVRVTDMRLVARVNRTGGLLMDTCEQGATAATMVERVAAAYPSMPRRRIEDDALLALRKLGARGVIRPALAPDGPPPAGQVSALPGLADL